MFSYHSQHFQIQDQKTKKLINQICSKKFSKLCWYWWIITLFKWFSDAHIILLYSGTTIQSGFALAL